MSGFLYICHFWLKNMTSKLQFSNKNVIILLQTYLLDGSPGIVFLSVFVTSSCDVGHNDDDICKIASPVCSFPVEILYYIHQVTLK